MHYKSTNEKNIYWYGAKIYIRGLLDDRQAIGRRNLFTRSPELVTGMFVKLADTFHYTNEDYFYPRLFIYDMAADFVQYYEKTKNEELNENLIKEFFMFFSEYLTNSVQDDKVKSEYTKWLDEIYFTIEDDYVGEVNSHIFICLWFQHGQNPDGQKRCPGSVPLAICKKLNYRTILNTRGVVTVIPEEDLLVMVFFGR